MGLISTHIGFPGTILLSVIYGVAGVRSRGVTNIWISTAKQSCHKICPLYHDVRYRGVSIKQGFTEYPKSIYGSQAFPVA